jgi:hypothetical protein
MKSPTVWLNFALSNSGLWAGARAAERWAKWRSTRLEYLKRRCRVLGPHNVEAVLFEQPGGKQPQNLLVVDHKGHWMRCFAHHP